MAKGWGAPGQFWHMALSLLVATLLPGSAFAADDTLAGAASAPFPTLEQLTVEWPITGDDDLDGRVTVRFRRVGDASWRDGIPLRRVPAGSNVGFSWSNKHSGSIFGLEPDTEYEIELMLTDPDGGSATTQLTARTRPVPRASVSATVVPVTPASLSGALGAAQPGQILELANGTYAGFTASQDGTETQPIVIRAASFGDAVVNGDVRADGRSYVFIEGLVVNGKVKFNNAEGIVVRGCTINTPDDGIVSLSNGVTNGYFADNVVLGPTGWSDATVGANGNNLGEGIQVTGPGNVIAYNYVKGFRDAISLLEDSGASNQVSIDIYNNDIEVGADDAIEADFCMGNCRILRNRITNSFVGLSSQPGLGGPTYFVRNVMYNVIYSPFKLHRGSVGDVGLHNTSVKCGDAFAVYAGDTWSHAFFRNNLFIGGEGGGTYGGYGNGSGRVAQLATADATCDFDYDGYGSIGTGQFTGDIGGTSFASLTEMQNNTTEQHARQVDMSVFVGSVTFPASGPYPERSIPDLRLVAGSAAENAGEILFNINDGYAGAAPDLGAYELGAALPHYGPRPGEHPSVPVMPGADAGTPDSGVSEGQDAAAADTGPADVGPSDSGGTPTDAAFSDAGVPTDGDASIPADRDAGSSNDAVAGTGGAGAQGGCGCASTGTSRWGWELALLPIARGARTEPRPEATRQ